MMNPDSVSTEDAMLLLNSLRKVGPVSSNRLIDFFDGDPVKIFQASEKKLLEVKGIGNTIINSIRNKSNFDWIKKERINLKKYSTNFISKANLPPSLNEIFDTPVGLYVKGSIPPGPYISIVGTRLPSHYAKKVCTKISTELAKAGFCIVSGMARGIDSIAHESALDSNGKTIAFLGCGMDIIYPPENLHLYNRITEKGAVITEFPFGRRADRSTFPMRNRLVSGFSSAVVVVESGSTGGSLITARFAAEQGRQVFAIPGRVDQSSSLGCHQLIRDGATLAGSAREIIEDLNPSLEQAQFHFSTQDQADDIKSANASRDSFSEIEKKIIEVLEKESASSFEDLTHELEQSSQEVSVSLSMLELNGWLVKRRDGKYELN